jgi:hypothetical protein
MSLRLLVTITERQERYLNDHVREIGISKPDFIRRVLDAKIEEEKKELERRGPGRPRNSNGGGEEHAKELKPEPVANYVCKPPEEGKNWTWLEKFNGYLLDLGEVVDNGHGERAKRDYRLRTYLPVKWDPQAGSYQEVEL